MYYLSRGSIKILRYFRKTDIWPLSKVKGHGRKWMHIYDFLYVCNTTEPLMSQGFRDTKDKCIYDLWLSTMVKGHIITQMQIYDFLYVYTR